VAKWYAIGGASWYRRIGQSCTGKILMDSTISQRLDNYIIIWIKLCVALSATAKKPIILLLFSAGPVNISEGKNNTNVGAILLCFYPGQGAGEALRRVLAVRADGTVVSPSARLPFTWPESLAQVYYVLLLLVVIVKVHLVFVFVVFVVAIVVACIMRGIQ